MKFSVIVPTYNESGCIAICLESIRGQDFPRAQFEIIVSDSSSTDGTAEIAKPLADRVVITEKRGIAHGRNYGAQHAAGDILAFADADVMLDKNFLKEMETAFQEKGVVGVTGIGLPGDGGCFNALSIAGPTCWSDCSIFSACRFILDSVWPTERMHLNGSTDSGKTLELSRTLT